MERDPAKSNKLIAAVRGYEWDFRDDSWKQFRYQEIYFRREAADLKAKLSERDTMITHLKRRVDEALSRGHKKVNEAIERSRVDIATKDLKLSVGTFGTSLSSEHVLFCTGKDERNGEAARAGGTFEQARCLQRHRTLVRENTYSPVDSEQPPVSRCCSDPGR